MNTKIFCEKLKLNSVPKEAIIFDSYDLSKRYIEVDDINEIRWRIKINNFQALKITPIDCANLNFLQNGDFPNACYEIKEGYPVPQFVAYIMEVIDSNWLHELRRSLLNIHEEADFMDKSKHFLIPCYDNIIEIIAWDIELTKI